MTLQGLPFHTLNRVFDQAIGLALATYTTQRALEVRGRRDEYLAFVAHDLRTPLNAISLAGEVLEMKQQVGSSGGAGATQVLKSLRRNVKQLEKLVGKVLDENANLQTELGTKLERWEFDLWPMVESLIHDLQPVARAASTALLNRVPDDLVIYADASLLAGAAEPDRQRHQAHAAGGNQHWRADLEADCMVECWVRDNGTGIPAEEIGAIFEKGHSDSEQVDATGLGLAIVKTFTEAAGGKVTVESEPGRGSTFRFSLPTKAQVLRATDGPSRP